jgi:hypothetical protein
MPDQNPETQPMVQVPAAQLQDLGSTKFSGD